MRIHKMLTLTAVLALSGTACADLAVENLNSPDRDRAISSPTDVQNLIVGGFVNWWRVSHTSYPGSPLSTAADAHSSSWGNWGMRDAGWEPRKVYDNDPSYSFNNLAESPWERSYSSLAGVRDGLLAINNGIQIFEPAGCELTSPVPPDCDQTGRAVAFGYFIQAMSFATLANFFDQAFIVDEDTDLSVAALVPTSDIFAAAMAKFDAAIAASQGQSWTIPNDWIGQEDAPAWSSARFVSIMRGYKARYRSQVARSPAERMAVDWSAVLTDTQGGAFVGGDYWGYYDGENPWRSRDKLWGCCVSGWARLDMRTIGPSDMSADGKWLNWLQTPPLSRLPFDIVTNDTRMALTEQGACDVDSNSGLTDTCGTHTKYFGTSPFPADRGTYHYSHYMWWGPDHRLNGQPGRHGQYIEFQDEELKFLAAEAECRPNLSGDGACSGSMVSMMALVNVSRTAAGLNPFTSFNNPDGSPECIPKGVRPTNGGTCGNLWEAYKYEKRIQLFHNGLGTEYYDDRGWGDLVKDTWLQLPVPGKELLLLLLDIYTFGGPGGNSSAPNFLNDFSPDALRFKAEALQRYRDLTEESFIESVR